MCVAKAAWAAEIGFLVAFAIVMDFTVNVGDGED